MKIPGHRVGGDGDRPGLLSSEQRRDNRAAHHQADGHYLEAILRRRLGIYSDDVHRMIGKSHTER
jgi:hypothetical protein